MYAIRLKPFRLVAEAFQQKRHQRQAVALGKFGIHCMKLSGVRAAVVGWQTHAYQHHLRFRFAARRYDGFEIVAHGVEVLSAQSVVAAERQQYQGGLVEYERGIDALQTALRGFTGDAGVGYRIIKAFLLQTFGKQVDPGLVLGQTVAG